MSDDASVGLHALPLAAATVGRDGVVVAVNDAFGRRTGARPGDAVAALVVVEDRAALAEVLAADGGGVARVRLAGASGEAVDAHVAAADGGARRVVVITPASDGDTWRRLVRDERAVREEEQKRISRELHDQLGADLSLLRMELARVLPHLRWTRRDVRDTVERMRDHAGGLLETVRRISRELRPAVLDHVEEVGLRAVLEFVAADVHRRTGLPVHLDAELDDRRVDAARAEAAYHVVREALTNVVRHAEATRAVVAARIAGEALVVQVMDDGRGAVADGAPPAGVGRLAMHERVAPWGGDVVVEAAPGAGTTVTVRIPLARAVP